MSDTGERCHERMTGHQLVVRPIGHVRSPLESVDGAPLQGNEGAPDAWLELVDETLPAVDGIVVGDEIFVLTWLHRAQRDVLKVHPRGDTRVPLAGVFATRSPDRPNPIGLHCVHVVEVAGNRIKVGPLEAIDGTPVIGIKPVLSVEGR